MNAQNPVSEFPQLSAAEARLLAQAAQRASGVAVSPTKLGFLEMRIGRRMREIGCPDFVQYIKLIEGPGGKSERHHLVEALTTHTTAFFREKAHFDWLSTAGLPALVERGAGQGQPLVIWSAACSLGSEMWTAAMVLDRFTRSRMGNLQWSVVGTDISRRILRRASSAVFSEDEIADLPEDYRRDYLLRAKGPGDRSGRTGRFRIAPQLRQKARLAHANVVDLSVGLSLTADVAFLRNVLIYFRPEDQQRAVANVAGRLRSGGYLLTGHSESLSSIPDDLCQIGASIYQKV